MKAEFRTLMKTVLNTADYSLETSGSTGYPSTSSTRSPILNSSWSHDDGSGLDSQRARNRSQSYRARSRSRSLDRERKRNPGERNGRHERNNKSSDNDRYRRDSR